MMHMGVSHLSLLCVGHGASVGGVGEVLGAHFAAVLLQELLVLLALLALLHMRRMTSS
jgi:hypothetical protein